MQVVLAAIATSDGTRTGVDDAVLSGEGVTIPAERSVLGKEIRTDPVTGDTSAEDLTVEVVKGGEGTFVTSQSTS